ncbi:MAG: LUD domain-containing protein [Burkholderiales bacterium]|nr:LUD domain-containing protein [Burkholderiales bacterium]
MNSRDAILSKFPPLSGVGRAPVVSPLPRPLGVGDLAAEFTARAAALQSTVERVAALDDVPTAIAAYLARLGLAPQLVCWPGLAALPWSNAGLNAVARPAEDRDLVGVTQCFAAIAETGTLMMCSGRDTPAVTSLLPETHIAVVPIERLVGTLEAGFAALRRELGQPPRAVNLVSGPSRTGDIEQTITLGAHGPYRMHILLIDGAAAGTGGAL